MKRLLSLLFTFGFALGISASAFAIPAVCGPVPGNGTGPPQGFTRLCTAGSNGQFNPVPGGIGQFVRTVVPGVGGVWNLPSITITTGDFEVTIDVAGKEDPFLALNFGATNFSGVSQSFRFSAGIPIILPAGSNVVQSSLAGTVTDPFGDGVTVLPVNSTILTSFLDGTTPMGVDVGPAITQAGVYSYLAGPIAGPTGSWSLLSVGVDFSLDGPFESISGTAFGRIDPGLVPTPEPSTLLLFGSGLVGLVFFKRRRKAA